MNSMKKRLLAAAVAAAMAVTAFSGAVLAETEPAAQPAPAAAAAGTEEYRWSFELKFDANGGTGAPATMTDGNNDTYRNTNSFKIPQQEPTREGYVFLGWAEKKDETTAMYKHDGARYYCRVDAKGEYGEGGFGTKTLYAVWEKAPQAPAAPDEAAVDALDIRDAVTVRCTNTQEAHGEATYGLLAGCTVALLRRRAR